MTNFRSVLTVLSLATAFSACDESPAQTATKSESATLYMDVHDLGPGNVTAEAVAKAHNADLSVQARHGVKFLHYWVDEQRGMVYCLSRAPNAAAIVETHREAHGLLPNTVGVVSDGE